MTDHDAAEQPITRTVLLDAQLAEAKPIGHIEIRRISIAPGHAAGLHVHNGPVVGSVVEGSVVYQVDGEPESVLTAGEVFFEPEGARIPRFDAQADGVTFLAYFPLGPGEQAAIVFPEE